MKRRIGLLLAAITVLATVGVFAPAPAGAVPSDACIGQGRAVLTNGLGYPTLFPKNTSTFTFAFTAGTCVFKTGLAAAGTVTGYCGQSEGKGTTTNGRSFVFTSLGTFLIITGELVGVVSAIPDPTIAGNSCLNKAGTNFIITGAVVKNPCTTAPVIDSKGKSLTLPMGLGNVPLGDLQTNIRICV